LTLSADFDRDVFRHDGDLLLALAAPVRETIGDGSPL